jgi:hypothetical protein
VNLGRERIGHPHAIGDRLLELQQQQVGERRRGCNLGETLDDLAAGHGVTGETRNSRISPPSSDVEMVMVLVNPSPQP